jgi:hypothetical protein
MQKLLVEHSWIILLVVLWSVPWKGVALWRAGRRGHLGWFIALLIINSLAILDILYIFIFSKMGGGEKPTTSAQPVPPRPQTMPNQNGKMIV